MSADKFHPVEMTNRRRLAFASAPAWWW